MHILLREWDPNACLVERGLARLNRRLPDIPKVTGFAPDAHLPIDRGVAKPLEEDLRRRVLDHPGDARRRLFEGRAGRIHVGRVLRAHIDVDAANVVPGVVGDRTSEHCAVRDDQLLVVERSELAGEQIDMLAGARFAVHLDEVAHLEGPKRQQHDACSEVAECALEGHADREGGSRQHGCEARGLNPEHTQASEDGADEDQVPAELGKEAGQSCVEVALLERRADPPLRPARDDPGEKECEKNAQDLGAVLDDRVDVIAHFCVHDSSTVRTTASEAVDRE